jgi:hypothetical protein
MPIELMLGVAYHTRDLPARDFLRYIDQSVRRVDSFDGALLRPASDDDGTVLTGHDSDVFERLGNTINLTHDSLARLDAEMGWTLSISLFSPEPGKAEAQFNPSPSGPESELVEANWRALTRILASYAETAEPALAAINGLGEDEEAEDIPGLEDAPGLGLPKLVVPWTYIGEDRLTPELRTALRDLPAFRSEPLGRGWLIQPVDHYKDKPPANFVERIRSLGGRDIKYHHTR